MQKDKSLQEYREKVWPSWEDLQQICASSTASGVGAVSSKGKDGTCTTKSSQIDLNKDVEVHEIESDETMAPLVCSLRSRQPLSQKKRNSLEVDQKKLQEDKNIQLMMP